MKPIVVALRNLGRTEALKMIEEYHKKKDGKKNEQ
jgi:hypothetical protein